MQIRLTAAHIFGVGGEFGLFNDLGHPAAYVFQIEIYVPFQCLRTSLVR